MSYFMIIHLFLILRKKVYIIRFGDAKIKSNSPPFCKNIGNFPPIYFYFSHLVLFKDKWIFIIAITDYHLTRHG